MLVKDCSQNAKFGTVKIRIESTFINTEDSIRPKEEKNIPIILVIKASKLKLDMKRPSVKRLS